MCENSLTRLSFWYILICPLVVPPWVLGRAKESSGGTPCQTVTPLFPVVLVRDVHVCGPFHRSVGRGYCNFFIHFPKNRRLPVLYSIVHFLYFNNTKHAKKKSPNFKLDPSKTLRPPSSHFIDLLWCWQQHVIPGQSSKLQRGCLTWTLWNLLLKAFLWFVLICYLVVPPWALNHLHAVARCACQGRPW